MKPLLIVLALACLSCQMTPMPQPAITSSKLDTAEVPQSGENCHIQVAKTVNLRYGSSTAHTVKRVLVDGTPVTLIEEQDGWSKVRVNTFVTGWVNSNFVSCPK